MNRLAQLLGSATRGNLVQALALSKTPLTSYRVAKLYNMNVAKAYTEMKRLDEMGLVEAVRRERGVEYRLADEDLKRLALKLSSRVITFDAWRSKKAKRTRFRMGLGSIPRVSLERPEGAVAEKPTRMPGELENLAVLGRKRFDAKYRNIGEREYGRV